MDIKQAMQKAFALSNSELAEALDAPTTTAASWRFKFKNGGLSLEKQIEILSKLGHKTTIIVLWKSIKS